MGEESDSDAVEEVRSGLIVEGAVEHDMGGVIEHLVAVAAAGRPDAVAILVVSLPPVQVRIAEAGMCGYVRRALDSEHRNITALAFAESEGGQV